MKLKIAILAGDGIGPEVTHEAVNILKAVAEAGGHDFTFTEALLGGVAITAKARRSRKRPSTPRSTPTPSSSARSATTSSTPSPRQAPRGRPAADPPGLGGFANLRPSVAYPALRKTRRCAPRSPRASTSSSSASSSAASTSARRAGGTRKPAKPSTPCATPATKSSASRASPSTRRQAPQETHLRRQGQRPRVSQLWRATVTELKEYPDITVEHQLVDSMAMHLMNIPRNFDVVLTENLFGDILSDESGIITGSLGMLPSATIGGKVNLFEPVHGSAPDIAGTGKANPLGAILTAAMVLATPPTSSRKRSAIEAAVQQVLDRRPPHRRHRPRQHRRNRHHRTDGQASTQRTRRIHRPPAVAARRLVNRA
jgi:3-isopropylmalate dehydrogenase